MWGWDCEWIAILDSVAVTTLSHTDRGCEGFRECFRGGQNGSKGSGEVRGIYIAYCDDAYPSDLEPSSLISWYYWSI